MTVLSACKSAALRLTGANLTTLFSSSDLFLRELQDQAGETAVSIAKEYDWQRLKSLWTLTGDGTNTEFSLPDDYDRMPIKSNLFSTSFGRQLQPTRDLDSALYDAVTGRVNIFGEWQILGGMMQITPAMSNTEAVKFYYVSNNIVADAGGAPKAAFTTDSDTFRLSERLLTLGVIWRWRAMKRLEYAEDMRNYEIALGQEITRDKGSRILTVGEQRIPFAAEFAFPGIIGP